MVFGVVTITCAEGIAGIRSVCPTPSPRRTNHRIRTIGPGVGMSASGKSSFFGAAPKVVVALLVLGAASTLVVPAATATVPANRVNITKVVSGTPSPAVSDDFEVTVTCGAVC